MDHTPEPPRHGLRTLVVWLILVAVFGGVVQCIKDRVASGPPLLDWGAVGLVLLWGALVLLAGLIAMAAPFVVIRRRIRALKQAGRSEDGLRAALFAVRLARRFYGPGITLASWLHVVATFHLSRREFALAEAAFRERLAMLEKQGSGKPDPARPQALAELGSALIGLGRTEEAERTLRDALAAFAELPQSHHQAWAMEQLAELRVAAHDYAEAEDLARRAFAVRAALLPDGGPPLESKRALLAEVLRRTGRQEEAEQIARQALGAVEAVTAPTDPLRCGYLALVARTVEERGARAEAEALYRQGLELARAANHPDGPTLAAQLARLRGEPEPGSETALAAAVRRADALATAGDTEAAIFLLEGAVQDVAPSRESALALGRLGQLQGIAGRIDEATRAFDQALAVPETTQDGQLRASLLNNRAFAFFGAGKLTEAEQGFRETLAHLEATLGPDDAENIPVLNNLADVLREQGRPAEAFPLFARAMSILEATTPTSNERWPTLLENLATCHRAVGEESRAEELESRAARMRASRALH